MLVSVSRSCRLMLLSSFSSRMMACEFGSSLCARRSLPSASSKQPCILRPTPQRYSAFTLFGSMSSAFLAYATAMLPLPVCTQHSEALQKSLSSSCCCFVSSPASLVRAFSRRCRADE
uniref:Uncharacterized protein n=1 Tax=Ixodes ricinus TaxID=34613 RepID=A0A6B0UMA4_IXORI